MPSDTKKQGVHTFNAEHMLEIANMLGISPESVTLSEDIRNAVVKLFDETWLAKTETDKIRMEVGICAHDLNNLVMQFFAIINSYGHHFEKADYQLLIEYTERIIEKNRGLMKPSKTGKLTAGNNEDVLTETDLREFMDKITVPFRRINPDIQFNIESENACSAFINPDLINYAMYNLLSNAVKAGSKHIGIKIDKIAINETNKSDESVSNGFYITISVKDDGCGIPEDISDNIFEPFVTSDAENGNGLGLASVQRQIRAHGGHVFFDSKTGDGSFTKFTLLIPDAELNSINIDHSDKNEVRTKSSLPPVPIIVVDNENSVSNLIDECIKKEGGQCKTVKSSDESLSLIKDAPENSVVILDGELKDGGMNGVQLAYSIKKIRPDIIIIYSSGAGPEYSQVLLDSGAINEFLPKPLSPKDIMNKLFFIGEQQMRTAKSG